jgi:hypothetical protein
MFKFVSEWGCGQAHARLWQCAAAMVLFHRAVRGMAPALSTSITPLLPTISHFAFDFQWWVGRAPFGGAPEPVTCYVPPLTHPFRALPNTQWFHSVTHATSNKRKL